MMLGQDKYQIIRSSSSTTTTTTTTTRKKNSCLFATIRWMKVLFLTLFWISPLSLWTTTSSSIQCDVSNTIMMGYSNNNNNYRIGFSCAATTRTLRREQRDTTTEESTSTTYIKDSDKKSIEEQEKEKKQQQLNLNQIIIKAGKDGLGGGVPGAIAGIVQVLTLMWLRTIINYQSRYGTSFTKAIDMLYKDGGIPRFYRGLSFALFQAPFARFISTAANDGVKSLVANLNFTKNWGSGRSTFIAAVVVGLARMLLMPIDTCKTVLQVDSVEGFRNLMRRVRAGKIGVLYQGAIANAFSSIIGHYPWFFTYNLLSQNNWLQINIPSQLIRNAGIGLTASIISDTMVNAIRVVKTTKQSIGSKHDLSYADAIRMVVAADGWKGLFGRGLRTRIFANALQSIVFTIIWRGLAEKWQQTRRRTDDDNDSNTTKESSTATKRRTTQQQQQQQQEK